MISFDKYSKAHNSEIISRGFQILMVIIYLMLDFKIFPYYSQFVKVSPNVIVSTKIPPFPGTGGNTRAWVPPGNQQVESIAQQAHGTHQMTPKNIFYSLNVWMHWKPFCITISSTCWLLWEILQYAITVGFQ